MSDNRIAPDGQIWVCHACGKTSKDRHGYSDKYPETSWGWDASCVMNSGLYKIEDLVIEDKQVKDVKKDIKRLDITKD